MCLVRWAVWVIRRYCLRQDNCNACPLKEKCGKICSER